MLETASECCILPRKSRPEGFKRGRKWSPSRARNRASREQRALLEFNSGSHQRGMNDVRELRCWGASAHSRQTRQTRPGCGHSAACPPLPLGARQRSPPRAKPFSRPPVSLPPARVAPRSPSFAPERVRRSSAARPSRSRARSRMSGATRRCPQTQVRAKRSTLRAPARAKHFSRMPGNSSSFLTLARSDRDLRMRLGPRELTEQARAISQRSASGPAPQKAARPKISTAEPARAAPRVQLTVPGACAC